MGGGKSKKEKQLESTVKAQKNRHAELQRKHELEMKKFREAEKGRKAAERAAEAERKKLDQERQVNMQRLEQAAKDQAAAHEKNLENVRAAERRAAEAETAAERQRAEQEIQRLKQQQEQERREAERVAEEERQRHELAMAEIEASKQKIQAEVEEFQRIKAEEDEYKRLLKEYPMPPYIQDLLDQDKVVIGLAGKSGIGKSTYINNVCGLPRGAPESAVIGFGKQGTYGEARAFQHPDIKSLVFLDLGGYGTPDFKPLEYMKEVGMRHMHVVLLMTKNRLTAEDVMIKEHLDENDTTCLILRNQVEFECMMESEETLRSKEECYEELKKNFFIDADEKFGPGGLNHGDVFFVDGRRSRINDYDSHKLLGRMQAQALRF